MTFVLSQGETFPGTVLNGARWFKYNGVSSASGAQFDPALATVNNGLTLSCAKQADGTWHGAGVGSKVNQQYGSWRVTANKQRGHGTTLCCLLWHVPSNTVYSEIDFAEDNGAEAAQITATIHWTDAGGVRRSQSVNHAVDETASHEYRVDWTPTTVTVFVDKVSFATVTNTAELPQSDMYLGIQTEPWYLSGRSGWEHLVDSTTPNPCALHVYAVDIYSYQAP